MDTVQNAHVNCDVTFEYFGVHIEQKGKNEKKELCLTKFDIEDHQNKSGLPTFAQ